MDLKSAQKAITALRKDLAAGRDPSSDLDAVHDWAMGHPRAEEFLKRLVDGESDSDREGLPSPDSKLTKDSRKYAATQAAVALTAEMQDLVSPPAEIETFVSRVDKEMKASPEDTVEKDLIYRDMELLRIRYTTRPYVDRYITARRRLVREKKLEDIEELDRGHPGISDAMQTLDLLRLRLRRNAPTRGSLEIVLAAARNLAAAVWIMTSMPLFFFCSVLRIVHPLLRALGVQNGHLPVDLVTMYSSRVALKILGVRVRFKGLHHAAEMNRKGTIGMFTHASNLDPLIVSAGPMAFKWVGKKEVFRIPVFGWLMAAWGHISIDRKNLQQAKDAINKTVVNKIHRWGRSICISPEGTRSHTGRLTDFKKGPFHLATKVNLPITPIIVTDAYYRNPRGTMLMYPGEVGAEYLPELNVKGSDVNALQRRVHRVILNAEVDKSGEEGVAVGQGNELWLLAALPYLFLWLVRSLVGRYLG